MLGLFGDSFDPDRPGPLRRFALLGALGGIAWLTYPFFVADDYDSFMRAGERAYTMGLNGRAAMYFNKAADARPEDRFPYVMLGLAYDDMNQPERAAECYRLGWPAMQAADSGDERWDRIAQATARWYDLRAAGW